MDRDNLLDLMQTLASAQGWYQVSEELIDELYAIISAEDAAISDNDVIVFFGNAYGQPGLKPAHVIQGFKQLRSQLLQSRVAHKPFTPAGPEEDLDAGRKPIDQMSDAELQALVDSVYDGRYKQVSEMRGRERQSSLAAIELARRKYIRPLTEARAAGKLPKTQVPGFSSMADLVPEAVR